MQVCRGYFGVIIEGASELSMYVESFLEETAPNGPVRVINVEKGVYVGRAF